MSRKRAVPVLLAALAAAGAGTTIVQAADAGPRHAHPRANAGQAPQNTVTPIQHVVVIFQENVSFDHYFGT